MQTDHNHGRQNSNTDSGESTHRTTTEEREPRIWVENDPATADRYLVHIEDGTNGATLPARMDGNGKPRMRDTDIAAWLGFKAPRMVRKLIKRMEKDGKLRGIDWRSTVERQSTGNGASREYTVSEAWLTREQALLVATQSDTPRAWKLTELMVKVFDAVLTAREQGKTVTAVSLDDVRAVCIEMIRTEMATTRAEVSEIRSLLKVTAQGLSTLTVALAADRAHGEKRFNWIERTLSQSGMVDGRFGPRHAKTIKEALKDCAASVHPKKTEAKAYAKLRSTMEKDLRLAIGIKQIAWTEVPASPENLAAAYSGLDRLRAQAKALRLANDKQQDLFKKN